MADHVLYFSQLVGLTDSAGRKLNDAQIPRIRPGEVKSFELHLLDYLFEQGDVPAIGGDTDCKSDTALKIVGTSAVIETSSRIVFKVGTTQAYADLWASVTNPSGILVIWMQLKVTKQDGRIHKLIFQLRGAPAVDGAGSVEPDPDYVTDADLAQAIANIELQGQTEEQVSAQIAVHDTNQNSHDDIREAIDGKADSTHNHDQAYSGISHNHDDRYLKLSDMKARQESFTIRSPGSAYAWGADIPLVAKAATSMTIIGIEATLDSASFDIAGDIKVADAFIGKSNAAVVNDIDTANGVRSVSSVSNGYVAAGKCLYLHFDNQPDPAIVDLCITIKYTV